MNVSLYPILAWHSDTFTSIYLNMNRLESFVSRADPLINLYYTPFYYTSSLADPYELPWVYVVNKSFTNARVIGLNCRLLRGNSVLHELNPC